MKTHAIEGDFKGWVHNALRQTPLFSGLDPPTVDKVVQMAVLMEAQANEVIFREGEAADRFYLLLMGEVVSQAVDPDSGAVIELSRVRPVDTIGDTSLLSGSPRGATVIATKSTYLLGFDEQAFESMVERLPGFSRRLHKFLATRLSQSAKKIGMPEIARQDLQVPDKEIFELLPRELIATQRVLPLGRDGEAVLIGFVDKPDRQVAEFVKGALNGLRMVPVRVAARDFDDLVRPFGLAVGLGAAEPAEDKPRTREPLISNASHAVPGSTEADFDNVSTSRSKRQKRSTTSVVVSAEQLMRIEPLLRAMVGIRASDLHLAARQRPRWRIDGDLIEIPDTNPMGEREVYDLLEPFISAQSMDEFDNHHDCDFAFAVDGIARFRVNMFRDSNGVGSALRLVPSMIPSMDQVGLSKGAQRLTELNQGLVLVCGPTGSGKSTTLAAMINSINLARKSHILTIEDPIEFHHESRTAKVTQREVGKNTSTFQRALRSALREDPDIVLVGELRDRDTMSLALETAQTGHLVFSTLHTSTAIGTIDRIIDLFPVEQHSQVRSTLADVLKGVINQNLCRRIGGGRVAAFETLLVSSAVSNCIRTAKTTQIATIMTTSKASGNKTMNEDLESLVRSRTIEVQEALTRSADRPDLRQRLGLQAQ
jgi:twitching motility protein PilT